MYPAKHVNPHFHTKGDEPYQILTSEGIMHIGVVSENTITWSPATPKKVGDTIIVKTGEVHSFEATGAAPVDFTFSCPDSHLSDEDRFFTGPGQAKKEYINPLPEYKNSSVK